MKWFLGIAIGLFCLFTFSFLVFESMGYLDQGFVAAKLRHVSSSHGYTLTALVIVGLLVGDLFLPVPASVVMTLSGYLFGIAGALYNFIGAMGAALLGFWLCRAFGRRAFRRLLDERESEVVERFFATYGDWAILLSRAAPMAAEVVSCLAGLSRMSRRRFVGLSALGSLPLCLLYAWAGAIASEPASGLALWLAILIPALSFALLRKLMSVRTRSAPAIPSED